MLLLPGRRYTTQYMTEMLAMDAGTGSPSDGKMIISGTSSSAAAAAAEEVAARPVTVQKNWNKREKRGQLTRRVLRYAVGRTVEATGA